MPDGPLHSIPFELLQVPGKDDLMIDHYDISYAYIFESLPNKNAKPVHVKSFGGFAPWYQMEEEGLDNVDDSQWIALRSGLIDIPEARKTTESLANKYGGKSWLGEKATKATFIAEAGNYDVLHLGMHSLLNEYSNALSSLVFYGSEDHELLLKEVQPLEIPASLVVLSACNTGVGRNVVGEGPLSLARAFFYAGTKSTLMSLWQVPDQQTSRIMQLFYNNLEEGMTRSQALREAKRTYLATASTLESHPAFWSGFVLVGDSSAMILPSRSATFGKMTKVGLLVVALLMIWFLFGKKIRSNFSS